MAEQITARITFRRILVALDDSRESRAVLRAAATLAARLESELVGLFVEDINLLRLAELPFAKEITTHRTGAHQFTSRDIQRMLRSQALEARRELNAVATSLKLKHSFSVARGQVTTELLARAATADMVALGKRGASLRRLGSTTRAVASKATATLMISEGQELSEHGTIVIAIDHDPCADRALDFAERLAILKGDSLVILLLPESAEDAKRLKKTAELCAAERDLHPQFMVANAHDPANFLKILQGLDCSLFVLSARAALLESDDIARLLRAIDIPTFILREDNSAPA